MINEFIIKAFDIRFLYVMKGNGKTKIGISKNPNERREDIDRQIDGKIQLLIARKFVFARKVEAALHRKYKAWHSPLKKKSSGSTEWFNFGVLKRLNVMFYIFCVWIMQRVFLVLIGLVALELILDSISIITGINLNIISAILETLF